MIADTSLKPGIMGQETWLSLILGALVLTVLWYVDISACFTDEIPWG